MTNKYILLVEDNKNVTDSLIYALENDQYLIKSVTNGEEGLDFLHNNPHPPFLILLDLMMPIMDGLEFRKQQQAHALFSSIPTVIISAKYDVENKLDFFKNEMFLAKPFDLNKLDMIINKYL